MVHVQMSPLIHVLDSSNRGSIAYDCLAFIMNNEACFRVVRNWHQFASSPTWLSNSLDVDIEQLELNWVPIPKQTSIGNGL